MEHHPREQVQQRSSSDGQPPARRVVIGLNGSGQSAVINDARDLPVTRLPNGILLQELWQQRTFPARPNDQPEPDWTLGPEAPDEGAVVRILTVPASPEDSLAVTHLHTDPSLHVITMLDGELDVMLEEGEVSLAQGDSIVLRGSMHDLRNRKPLSATFVYTSFPLTPDGFTPPGR